VEIRRRKLKKDRQYHGQKKMDKLKDNKIIYRTLHRKIKKIVT